MHKTWAAPVAHEDVFVEHYAWLREWARTLAKGDRSLADDLLHTAYVQFTTRRPDLGAVRDLEAYLYTLLRNLHLSHARWASRHEASLTVVDYDSVTLAVHNAGAGIEVWDQLRAVCAYACRRKETSKAGSVLLLRFFHGYFPSEIGKILRSPPKTVNEWLRLARCEARTYLENPGALAFAGDARTAVRREAPQAGGADGFADLRREIFAARAGVCLDPADLRRLYQPATGGSVPCGTLAHIVSCASCLDAVTRLLALHGYDERDPTDTLGNNSSSIGGRSVPSRPSGPTPLELRAWETGRLTVLEHEPKELQIGVNGFRLSAVRVRSAVTDLGLTVPLSEPIDFIEIRSEQSVRLLIFEVDPPPRGAVEQTATVTLSNGRRLDATLSFADSWPALHIAYHDPQWTAQPAPELEPCELDTPAPAGAQERAREPWVAPRIWDVSGPRRSRWRHLRAATGRGLGRAAALSGLAWIGRLALAHRQAAVTTALMLLALAWWAPGPWREAPLSAAELLDRTRTLERQVLSPADLVVRRVIELEERRPPDARAVARRRIEVWRNAGKRLAVKRAYDEAGRLIAGEWTRADGSRTLYRTGAAPETRADGDAPRLTPEDVWRLEPLAADFERLVGTAAQAGVEERGNSYVVHYRSREQGGELLEATLTIDKDSQHAVAQTLLVRHDGALREYRFSEADVDRLPEGDVRPEAFEPEPILLGQAPPPIAELITAPRRPARARVRAPAPTGALLDPLEMAVWHVLHRHQVCLKEQGHVERTRDGHLAVVARTATAEHASLVAAALARLTATWPGPTIAVDVTASALPEGPDTERGDADVHALGSSLRERVARRAGHWQALDELVTRWASHPLMSLHPDAADQWNSMVQDHARGLALETAALRATLEAVWKIDAAPAPEGDAAERAATEAIPFSRVPALLDAARDLSATQDAWLEQAAGACETEPCRPREHAAALLSSLSVLERLIERLSAPWIQGQ